MKIKHGPLSKRTSVHTYQAAFLAKSIRQLDDAYARQFRGVEELTLMNFTRLQGLEEYRAFMEAALVCGFVCDDFNAGFSIEDVHARPRMLLDLPFQKVRHYIHTIQRTEKWCSQYSTALFDSLKTGALVMVAERLDSDMSLHESNSEEEEIIVLKN